MLKIHVAVKYPTVPTPLETCLQPSLFGSIGRIFTRRIGTQYGKESNRPSKETRLLGLNCFKGMLSAASAEHSVSEA